MSYGVTEGSGSTFDSDDQGNVKRPIFIAGWGSGASRQIVGSTTPLPVREPTRGNALSKGGVTSTAATGQVAATNANRQIIEVSNGGDSGVWLAFGSTAVAGQGSYLPPKATGYWFTTAQVNCILEAGGTGGPIGFTEW